MQDPVRAADGISYERTAILSAMTRSGILSVFALADGSTDKSPVLLTQLSNRDLAQNAQLREGDIDSQP